MFERAKEGGCPMFAGACAPSEGCGPCEPKQQESSIAKGPQAVFLRHVTLSHGTKLEQGQVLVKTWSVQNNGTESWPENAKLIFLRGDRELLGETEEFSVVAAKPSQTVEVSVPITTPVKAGSYSAYFQLANVDRAVFGPRLSLEVTVTRDEEDERKAAPVAAAPAVIASIPVVDTSGWVDVKVETSPVVKPAPTPASVPPALTPSAPVTVVAPVVTPNVVAKPVVPVAAPKPVKFETQLNSLSDMGFKNTELNSFLLEKHNGDIQQVTGWLLENMNH
jgi:hypothetical protein